MQGNARLEGGCLCGALRYRSDAAPIDTGYCHCELCRRSTGAPTLVWASVPVARFSYTKGKPTIYPSSKRGQREFCATCGTQIAFREAGAAETVDINVGSLDDPASFPPQRHIWDASRLPWFETADALPRHARGETES